RYIGTGDAVIPISYTIFGKIGIVQYKRRNFRGLIQVGFIFDVTVHQRVTIEAPSLSAGPSGFVVGALVGMLVTDGPGFRVVIDHMIGTVIGPKVMFQRGIGMKIGRAHV